MWQDLSSQWVQSAHKVSADAALFQTLFRKEAILKVTLPLEYPKKERAEIEIMQDWMYNHLKEQWIFLKDQGQFQNTTDLRLKA
jgi:hypothetical protein